MGKIIFKRLDVRGATLWALGYLRQVVISISDSTNKIVDSHLSSVLAVFEPVCLCSQELSSQRPLPFYGNIGL